MSDGCMVGVDYHIGCSMRRERVLGWGVKQPMPPVAGRGRPSACHGVPFPFGRSKLEVMLMSDFL